MKTTMRAPERPLHLDQARDDVLEKMKYSGAIQGNPARNEALDRPCIQRGDTPGAARITPRLQHWNNVRR